MLPVWDLEQLWEKEEKERAAGWFMIINEWLYVTEDSTSQKDFQK